MFNKPMASRFSQMNQLILSQSIDLGEGQPREYDSMQEKSAGVENASPLAMQDRKATKWAGETLMASPMRKRR